MQRTQVGAGLRGLPTYAITDLVVPGGGATVADDLNDRGDVAGTFEEGVVMAGPKPSHPFLYHNHKMIDLDGLHTGLEFFPILNGRGQLLAAYPTKEDKWGWKDTHLCLFADNRTTDLGTLHHIRLHPTALNNRGQVLGDHDHAPQGNRPLLFSDRKYQDLGSLGGYDCNATALNEKGQVVGWSHIRGSQPPGTYPIDRDGSNILPNIRHAFLYSDHKMHDLGALDDDDSWAWAINNRGQIVGYAGVRTHRSHAFLYSQHKMVDLGTLGDYYSTAFAINDAGQIVGTSSTGQHNSEGRDVWHAFLYTDGKMIDLNSLLPPESGWTLETARRINVGGQIAGYGYRTGDKKPHAFLLTPIHPPSPHAP